MVSMNIFYRKMVENTIGIIMSVRGCQGRVTEWHSPGIAKGPQDGVGL